MRNHKICKKAILKFNISWRHNINDFLMYNVLFVQKSSVYNASLTNFRAKKIRELATKKFFYFLFFFLSICPTYGENLKRIWDYSNSICYFDKELLIGKNRYKSIAPVIAPRPRPPAPSTSPVPAKRPPHFVNKIGVEKLRHLLLMSILK